MKSRFYATCELGIDAGRVLLGNLQDRIVISEVRRFENTPLQSKEREWDVAMLYTEMMEGLRLIGASQEPLESVSCCSWSGDYMLFEADRTLISPVYQSADSRTQEGIEAVRKRVSLETLFGETGVQSRHGNMIFQLAAENPRRLRRASELLPIADGFNYLLSGVARTELSQASTTQLLDPRERNWSPALMDALRLNPRIFPPLVASGTELGALRPDLAEEAGLEDVKVLAGCSYNLASALMGLPVAPGGAWAYLTPLRWTSIGTVVPAPILDERARESGFTNELGFGGETIFHKEGVGLWLLEECQREWSDADRGLDFELLSHLATSAPPFESLFDPSDPTFLQPGNVQQKIQAYCKETGQTVPRKPGPMFRCILESLALMYRRMLEEMEYITGTRMGCLYVFGEQNHLNSLLNHFTANSVQLPVVVIPRDTTALGSIVIQALTNGHIKCLEEARQILHKSVPSKTILPHGTAWDNAYQRMLTLKAA